MRLHDDNTQCTKSPSIKIFLLWQHPDTLLDTFSFPLLYCLFGLGDDTVLVLVYTKIRMLLNAGVDDQQPGDPVTLRPGAVSRLQSSFRSTAYMNIHTGTRNF